MSSDTRGPRKGRIPPHIQERVDRKRERRAERLVHGPWYRRRWFLVTAAAVVALIAGTVLGRMTAPDPVAEAAAGADEVIGILDRSEVLWRVGSPQGAPPVSVAVEELRGTGTTATVEGSLDQWIAAYDQVIGQLETAGVPAAADGVRRLALASAQLSKDAVETLGAAATAEGDTRALLLDEVERIRARAEQYDASARRLLAELRGEDAAEAPAPAASVPTLPRPVAPAASPPPGASPDASPVPSPDAGSPEPTAQDTAAEPSPDSS